MFRFGLAPAPVLYLLFYLLLGAYLVTTAFFTARNLGESRRTK